MPSPFVCPICGLDFLPVNAGVAAKIAAGRLRDKHVQSDHLNTQTQTASIPAPVSVTPVSVPVSQPTPAAQVVPDLLSAMAQASADTGTPTTGGEPITAPAGIVNVPTVPLAPVPPTPSNGLHDVFLSPYGKQVAEEWIMLFKKRAPGLVLGETGDGKSILARYVVGELIARQLVRPDYRVIPFNFSVGTNVDILIGQTVLVNNEDGPGQKVVFIPGMLTLAIEYGYAFLGEEMTRANQELLSRFYGILDSRKQDRYWSVPEGIIAYRDGNVKVHPDHWFMGTANPEGGGYLTQRFDPAFRDRWFAIIPINELLADERKIVESKIADRKMVEMILKFAQTVRGNEKTRVTTRQIVQLCDLIEVGFEPVRAVEVSIAMKFRELKDGVIMAARAHFPRT